jgi:hypothetical protein
MPGVGHVKPGSRVHVALQPSDDIVFPSSHCSPASTVPLPQTGGVVVWTQGWPAVVQDQPCSTAHEAEHPSPEVVFPSSHASLPSIFPSPHTCTIVETHGCPAVGHMYPGSIWQRPSQPSPGFELPSSHCSPASTTLSPHTAAGASVHASPAQLDDEAEEDEESLASGFASKGPSEPPGSTKAGALSPDEDEADPPS